MNIAPLNTFNWTPDDPDLSSREKSDVLSQSAASSSDEKNKNFDKNALKPSLKINESNRQWLLNLRQQMGKTPAAIKEKSDEHRASRDVNLGDRERKNRARSQPTTSSIRVLHTLQEEGSQNHPSAQQLRSIEYLSLLHGLPVERDYPASLPLLPTDFIQSVRAHLHAHWEVARTASLDQISRYAFSSRRAEEIGSIRGSGYLAERYALKVADTLRDFTEQKGIRSYNEESAGYHRSDPEDGFLERCRLLYEKVRPGGKELINNSCVVFAHSHIAAERLKNHSPYMFEKNLPGTFQKVEIHPITEGLVAVEFQLDSEANWGEYFNLKWGGLPSLYEVMKRAHPEPDISPVLDPHIDNTSTLHKILSDLHLDIPKRIAAIPEENPLKNLANILFSEVNGLNILLERKGVDPSFKQNPIIAGSLNTLAKAVKNLPSQIYDEMRFFNVFEIIVDEIITILISVKPYKEKDFKCAALDIFHARLGNFSEDLPIRDPEVHLFSSGMDAFITAVEIAMKEAGSQFVQCISDNDKELLPDYFETIEAVGFRFQKNDPSGRVFLANLNPSVPFKRSSSDKEQSWDVDKLINSVNQKLSALNIQANAPLYLILDATIDKPNADDGTSDLGKFIKAMARPFAERLLRVLSHHSDQKGQSLLSRRIMAGGVTIIGFNDAITQRMAEAAREKEQRVGWIRNDECQFLMHIKKHAHAHELISIRNAAKNIEFMHQHCFSSNSSDGFLLHEPGLPVAILTNGKEEINIKLSAESSGKGKTKRLSDLMELMFDYHNGFSYLQTTFTKTPTTISEVRISGGQESFELSIERSYSIGWIKQRFNHGTQLVTVADVMTEIESVTNKAYQTVLQKADIYKWADTAISVLEKRLSRLGEAPSRELVEKSFSLEELKFSLKNLRHVKNKFEICVSSQLNLHDGWVDKQRRFLINGQENLRVLMTKALNETRKYSTDLVDDEIKLVSSAFKPVLPDSARKESDISVIRSRLERNPIGMNCKFTGSERDDRAAISARYSMNKVASLLALFGKLFSEELGDHEKSSESIFYEKELQKLNAVFESLFESGLSSITPWFRTMVLDSWSELSKDKIGDPIQQKRVVTNLVKFSRLISWNEEKAKTFDSFPLGDFENLPFPLQMALIRALFKSLDMTTKAVFIQRMVALGQESKVNMCLSLLEEEMNQADKKNIEWLTPSKIDGSAIKAQPYELVNRDQRRLIIRDGLLNEIIKFPKKETENSDSEEEAI